MKSYVLKIVFLSSLGIFSLLQSCSEAHGTQNNDSFYQDRSNNRNRVDSVSHLAQNMINSSNQFDSIIILPLEKVYGNTMIGLIKSKSYNESSTNLIMSFWVNQSGITLANNDKQTFQFYDFSVSDIIKSINYPTAMKVGYIDPVSRIFVKDNFLYCATYNNNYKLEQESGKVVEKDNLSFGKNKNRKLRVFEGCKVSILTKNDNLNQVDIPNSGLDIVIDKKSNTKYMLFFENKELKLVKNSIISKIELNNLSANFIDIDFLYSSDSIIGFVLKSNMTEIDEDVFVIYDSDNKSIKFSKSLKSYVSNVESQIGDPVCFPTGTVYKLTEDNILWRLRTTVNGVYLENWQLKW